MSQPTFAQKKQMEMRVLPVVLTDEEIEAKGRALARESVEARDHEAAIAKRKAEHKEEIEALTERLKEMKGAVFQTATAITSGRVFRDIPCDWFFHLDSGVKVLVRRDTGVAVERKQISEEERQLAIGEVLQEATAPQLALWASQLADQEKAASGGDEPAAEE